MRRRRWSVGVGNMVGGRHGKFGKASDELRSRDARSSNAMRGPLLSPGTFGRLRSCFKARRAGKEDKAGQIDLQARSKLSVSLSAT